MSTRDYTEYQRRLEAVFDMLDALGIPREDAMRANLVTIDGSTGIIRVEFKGGDAIEFAFREGAGQ